METEGQKQRKKGIFNLCLIVHATTAALHRL